MPKNKCPFPNKHMTGGVNYQRLSCTRLHDFQGGFFGTLLSRIGTI